MSITAKLGIGPMSPEVIEGVYSYSEKHNEQLMLIASRNQIDYNGGYVNNWTTKEYMDFICEMEEEYLCSDIIICRDHCGAGFGNPQNPVQNTIEEDISMGFDLMHIDYSKCETPENSAVVAIKYCRMLDSSIAIEVGTDEIGTVYTEEDCDRLIQSIARFAQYDPEFMVLNTGSLVRHGRQVGSFNPEMISKVVSKLKVYGIKLKEHNADWLTAEEIAQRSGIVDAMNIAPELGLLHTDTVLDLAAHCGVSTAGFLNKALNSEKWKPWTDDSSDEILKARLAGHYVLTSDEYKQLERAIGKERIRIAVIENTEKVIARYLDNWKS